MYNNCLFSKISHDFTIPVEGTIWRVLPIDGVQNEIILEIRDATERSTSFAHIDTNNGDVIQLLSPQNSWWSGFEFANKDYFITHGYDDEQNPIKKGIEVIDIKFNECILLENDYEFKCIVDNKIIVEKEGTFFRFENQTLTETASLEPDRLNTYLQAPAFYEEGSSYFETVAALLQQFLGVKPSHAIEYVELNGLIIISYYLFDQDLTNYICIINEDGTVLVNDLLISNVKGVGLMTFFIIQQQIGFIKNKKELVVLKPS